MSNLGYVQTKVPRLTNHTFKYDNLLSGQIGKLIPIQVDEVNPRERWRENIAYLMRMTPMSSPAMAKMNVQFYSFFVPSRIITPRNSQHSTWEKFVQSVGKHSTEIPELPTMYTSTPLSGDTYTDDVKTMLKEKFSIGSLSDYLDYPVASKTDIDNDNLFNIPYDFRLLIAGYLCYQMIYNYWFRRDQIEGEILFPLGLENVDISNPANSVMESPEEWDGTEEAYKEYFFNELFKLRTKNYERDYFTSSLPEPQFGEDTRVGDGAVSFFFDSSNDKLQSVEGSFTLQRRAFVNSSAAQCLLALPMVQAAPGGIVEATLQNVGARRYTMAPSDTNMETFQSDGDLVTTDFQFDRTHAPFVNMETVLNQANLTANTFTINEFRVAMQMQSVKEAINRGGTMYIEIMQNVYDSVVPDARLQQPVYLGGISCPVQIGTVVQSSETTSTTPLGTLAGKAQSANGGQLFRSKKAFDEHGYVVTIACVAPRTGYIGGVPRKWWKRDPLDYYNKYFAHLGEQPVYKGELHFNPWDGTQGVFGTFGYQERYTEYRKSYSRAHGEMRSTKDNWNIYRKFDALPSLSTDFIKMEKEDFDRIFEFENITGTSDEHFDLMVSFDIVKKSPVPKYGTPYSFI